MIYAVKIPSITKREHIAEKFMSFGFTDYSPKIKGNEILQMSYRFWIFSLEKMSFISSSTNYDKPIHTVEEFEEKIKGFIHGKKFGI